MGATWKQTQVSGLVARPLPKLGESPGVLMPLPNSNPVKTPPPSCQSWGENLGVWAASLAQTQPQLSPDTPLD